MTLAYLLYAESLFFYQKWLEERSKKLGFRGQLIDIVGVHFLRWRVKMEYKEIFGVESRRLLEIFKLLKSADNNTSLEKLSSELGINPKTMLRYMEKIKKLFKNYQLDNHLAICRPSTNHFYLKRDNELYLDLFIVHYLSDLPEIIFLKAIIEEEKVQAKQLAENLLLSESSMRRRVKKINDWLKKFDIRLSRGTYELEGEEVQIRALILRFYGFVYHGTKNNFLLQAKERNRQLTNQLVDFFQMKINDVQRESLFRIVKITTWRYQQGNKMRVKKEWKQYIEDSSIFPKFIEAIGLDKLDLEELTYLYLMIQACYLPYFSLRMQAYIVEEHYVKKTSCYSKMLVTTNKLRYVFWEKKFNHSKESIVAFIGFHLYYELISNFSFERHQSTAALQEKFPSFTHKLNECLAGLIKENTIYQKIPKEALFYRYFMILSSLITPVYSEKRIFICLMTDLSLEKEKELGKRLTNFFYNRFNLVVIYARTTKSILYADMILTTVVYHALEQKYTQPILLIELDFSEDFFFKIEKLLKKVR